MNIKQFLRLPSEHHAIKEASISLFFGSQFVHAAGLRAVLERDFATEFNQVQEVQGLSFRLEAKVSEPGSTSASSQALGPPGIQAQQLEQGTVVRALQARNEPERTTLTLHNLRYSRWADFLALFERVANALAPQLANMVVVAASLHYVDELQWTHPTEPLPLAQLYQANPAYLPRHFFDSPFSELLLTVPNSAAGIAFFDRLHITSLHNDRPVATISHNLVHQFEEINDLSTLLQQPNQLTNVLQQAHEQNKTVLRNILQPDILSLIGLTA